MDKKETSTHPNEISKIKAENLLVSALEKEIIKELGDKLKVPERLINPDKLIIAAKNCLGEEVGIETMVIWNTQPLG